MTTSHDGAARADTELAAAPPTPVTVVAAPPAGPRPGDRIGRYVVEDRLGQGGMGVVVAARDPGLGRQVALKVVRPDVGDRAYRARLVREARAMAQLEHPNVVRIYDAGEEGGEVFIAMELVRGETLGRWLRAAARPWREVVARFVAAGRGLAAAHHAGLVHRDFKPDNVLVRSSDDQVCVTDFGLAVPAGAEASGAEASGAEASGATGRGATTGRDGGEATTRPGPDDATAPAPAGLTRTGAAVGTPAYMAPEQHRGEDVDARADVYSFCVSLHEGLYGSRPFEVAPGLDPASAWSAAIERGLVRVPAGARRVPRAVRRAVLRGLAFDPAARWPAIDDLLDALERAARRRWIVPAAAAGVVGAAAIAALMVSGGTGEPAVAEGAGVIARAQTPAVAAPTPTPLADLAAARPITDLGGCAEGPAFVDDHTLAFELSKGAAVDLWTVDVAGRDARALATGPLWDWRPNTGRRPGEVVYLETQPDGEQHAAIVARDVASGAELARIDTLAYAVAADRDAIYYVGNHGVEIHRRSGDHDAGYITLPAGIDAQQLVRSPAGDRFAIVVATDPALPRRVCTVDPSSPPACTTDPIFAGRPAFGADGAGLYFGAPDGIHRRDVATHAEQVVVPGAIAKLGVAVSPDGTSLVYSSCVNRQHLVDVARPAQPLVDDDAASDPAAGPDGMIAWVHDDGAGGHSLVLRRKDGATIELVAASFGVVRTPSFEPGGHRLAFASSGKHTGIFTVGIDRNMQILQLTDGATDAVPLWTRDGRVVFRRTDDGNILHVFIADGAGGVARQALPAASAPLTANLVTGEILLATPDDRAIWWDPITGRRGGVVAPPRDTTNVVVSPGGRWLLIQRGAYGLSFWRAPAARPDAIEEVATFPGDTTVGTGTIDDDGRVIATPGVWRGELQRVPARAGARF